jgi:hypothetical protein
MTFCLFAGKVSLDVMSRETLSGRDSCRATQRRRFFLEGFGTAIGVPA